MRAHIIVSLGTSTSVMVNPHCRSERIAIPPKGLSLTNIFFTKVLTGRRSLLDQFRKDLAGVSLQKMLGIFFGDAFSKMATKN